MIQGRFQGKKQGEIFVTDGIEKTKLDFYEDTEATEFSRRFFVATHLVKKSIQQYNCLPR